MALGQSGALIRGDTGVNVHYIYHLHIIIQRSTELEIRR